MLFTSPCGLWPSSFLGGWGVLYGVKGKTNALCWHHVLPSVCDTLSTKSFGGFSWNSVWALFREREKVADQASLSLRWPQWRSHSTYGRKWISVRNFHTYRPIWVKFGIQNSCVMLVSGCEFHANFCSGSHTLLNGSRHFLTLLTHSTEQSPSWEANWFCS